MPHFHADVLAALDSPVSVVRTHGDFLGHNFRRAGDEIWVFDWEEYTDCGPFLVDEIGFFLCVYRYGLNKSVQEVNQLFIENYLRKGGDKCRDAVLALAFLFGANIAMAQDIVSLWQPLSKNTR
ncbi:MAG: hypothetical protein GX638_18535 [Crenarchaeota archaeon]|nr:hypothetical protein [Thermoproteota archaeon]